MKNKFVQQFTIETTQNVGISYKIAPLGDRIIATFIDVLIMFAFWVGLLFVVVVGTGDFDDFDPSILQVAIMVLMFLGISMYHLLFEIFLNGQSIGKYLMGIKVVKVDGSSPSIGDYFLRWLLRLVDITFSNGAVGILCISSSNKGQRVGDIAAGTTVVSIIEDYETTDTIFQFAEEDYEPQFKEAAQLDEALIGEIKSIMHQAKQLSHHHVVSKLSQTVSEIMEIETILPPKKFLETVVKDYNYMNV